MNTLDQDENQRIRVAERVREAREYLGLSQDDVAKVLGLSRPAVTNIESGTRRLEAVELDKLSRLYGRSADYFLTGEENVGASATDDVKFLARAMNGLSDKDRAEVMRFADFLKKSADVGRKVPRERGSK
jgi:transcriptional regulator with XRE-family HTH domain